jgi:hypothetical protein
MMSVENFYPDLITARQDENGFPLEQQSQWTPPPPPAATPNNPLSEYADGPIAYTFGDNGGLPGAQVPPSPQSNRFGF